MRLIEGCREQAHGRGERLAWLRSELSQRPLTEIVQFQVCLDQVTHAAFTWDLWAAADQILGGWCSERWPIPTAWPTLPRSSVWWGALGRAGTTTGLHERAWITSRWRHTDSAPASMTTAARLSMKPSPQQNGESAGRGPVGQQWDVRHEDEAVRKLPRLSAAFPLRPLAL
ncbi:DUF4240 domain-containing protein [Streptomyces mirabilis]|uniref:DUF4240 domain-containing protein n=1 Tax=Streptomyces mirabilis TaxID=68239 RepID=UPI00368C7CE2